MAGEIYELRIKAAVEDHHSISSALIPPSVGFENLLSFPFFFFPFGFELLESIFVAIEFSSYEYF